MSSFSSPASTPIPSLRKRRTETGESTMSPESHTGDASSTSQSKTAARKSSTFPTTTPPTQQQQQRQVQQDESRHTKIIKRIVYGAFLFGVFVGTVYAGHSYICALVATIELLLFRELVRVRYSTHFSRIHQKIPLFRTTQWLWFAVAIIYTYGDFVSDVVQSNRALHYLLPYTQHASILSFFLYSGTFVLSITTLQRDHIRFQINQLCWTVLVSAIGFCWAVSVCAIDLFWMDGCFTNVSEVFATNSQL